MRKKKVPMLAFAALAAALAGGAASLAVPEEAGAAFPGQNGRIAFEIGPQSSYDRPTDIATVGPGGGGFSRVTGDGTYPRLGSAERGPAFSPDGATVAFAAFETTSLDPDGLPGDQTDTEIYTVPASGGTPTRLTNNNVPDFDPAFSPDGKRVAFVSYGEPTAPSGRSGPAVFAMDADGAGRTNLTPGRPGYPEDPDWSPDGKKIAFSEREASDADSDVLVVPAAGGTPARLDAAPDVHEARPSWSPDGKKIAYEARRAGSSFPDIYVAPAAGGTPVRLNTDTGRDFDLPGGTEPAFSPNGRLVAFTKPESEYTSDIYATPVGGGPPFRITSNGISSAPDWAPVPGSAPPADATEPTVTGPRPLPGSEIRDRTPAVRATVRDGQGGLAKADVRLYVDGARRSFSYDPETGRLSRTTGRLSYGRHSVRLVARDAAGNAASEAWSFRVVRGR